MKRTIVIRIKTTSLDKQALLELRNANVDACHRISLIAHKERYWNRVALHNKVYTEVRKSSPLASHMMSNTIFSVCNSSKLCLQCGCLGVRHKNTFSCQCGNRQHSDLYACEKLCRLAQSADRVTAIVNSPMVAVDVPLLTSFCL